jgi:mono/diheme cytochrome c family protein
MAPPRRPRRNVPSRPRGRAASNRRARVLAAVVAIAIVAALVLSMVLVAGGGSGSDDDNGLPDSFDAARAFQVRCSGCHGANGVGGSAPQLSDGVVVQKYPNIDDQIAVVANGRALMPAFKARGVSDAEIRAIVEYTRTQL